MGRLDNSFARDEARVKVYRAKRRPMNVEDWKALGWDEDEAERSFLDNPQTRTVIEVVVPPEHDGATGYMYELRHHSHHSPDGFEWGYGGSGPSELARCILIDYFDLHDQAEQDGGNLRLPASYQNFKREFIETASHEGFEITGDQIAGWVVRQAEALTT